MMQLAIDRPTVARETCLHGLDKHLLVVHTHLLRKLNRVRHRLIRAQVSQQLVNRVHSRHGDGDGGAPVRELLEVAAGEHS